MKNFIKKHLFTNRVVEYFLINAAHLVPLFERFYPSNTHYPKHTIRRVKRDGQFFKLDISDYQEYLIYFNLEQDTSKGVIGFLPKNGGLILDIGANIGQTSLWMASALKKKNVEIIAIEPYPSTYKKLVENIKLNESFNIHTLNIAFGNSFTKLLMDGCSSNSGAFRVNSTNEKGDFVEVKQTTLDAHFLNNYRKIDFIKIDVEGFEYNVIKGGVSLLKRDYPVLFIEIDNENLKAQNSSAVELIQLLKELGYNYILRSDTLKDDFTDELEHCHFDIIVRKN
jgi:FkbM family methyltransferase